MNSKLNVFFTIDQGFIQHFSVAVISLLENNKDLDLQIHLIHDMLDTSELNYLLTFIRDKYNIVVNVYTTNNLTFSKYPISLHVSRATYFRLLLADILPQEIKSGLYLDADIVVAGSLKALVNVDLKSNALMAVDDVDLERNIDRIQKLGFPATKYFNAGIMLLNLDFWRQKKSSQGLVQLAEKYMDKIQWWDQDLLNMFFYNDWAYLDFTYNALHLKKKLQKMPVIIHYASSSKPWSYLNEHPYKSLYWHYLQLTPYKDARYKDYTVANILVKYWRRMKSVAKYFIGRS